MPGLGLLENGQHPQARQGDLEPRVLEVCCQLFGSNHAAYHNGVATLDPIAMPEQPLPRTLLLIGSLLALTACGSVKRITADPPGWLTPYRADIGQGNFITQEQAGRLQKGMSREQVRGLLGTPLLIDPFRSNRWDYVFDIRRGSGGQDRRRFFVIFDQDTLNEWGGDELPAVSGDVLLPMRPAR